MVIMMRNKSVSVVLLFTLFLSFGLLCSAKDFPGRRSEDDPRQRYEDCRRRCQSETRGQTEQDKCEDRCERQFKEEQQREGEDPQRTYQDCRQHCQQEERRLRPQCEQSCQEQYERQQQQQPDNRFKNDPRQRYDDCQRRCQSETRGQTEQDKCEDRCERQFKEEQQREGEDPQRTYQDCRQHCQQEERRLRPQCEQSCQEQYERQQQQQPDNRFKNDPRQRYDDCRRRCQSETRGQTEQDKCEDRCERQFKEEQQREGEDPQRTYQDCRQHCQQEERRLRPQCEQSCQEQYERQQQQQPDKRFKECQQRCQRQEQRPERKQQCVKECREQYQEDPWKGERENKWREEEEEESDEGEQQQRNNPYYFHRRSFQERFREEHGNFRVLQRFADKHHLLRGINEFRIAILEANPNTFVLPHHCDAEKIFVVTNGRGTITFVTHENKESYNVAPGVVVRIPAGSTVYLANQDNREKLTIAVLHRPVNNPGQFQKFFPAGQENPQSYLRIFSREILEAVFNTRSEQLDELFGGRQSHRRQQGQGMFRKASQEQIRALSQEATSPRGKGSEGYAFNLLSQTPRYSNQNGRFYEACPRNFQQQLREVDSSVVAFEINKGSIFVPHYNSKATFVVLVTDGNGHVEMVCPHLSRQSSHWSSREEEEQEEQEDERRSGQYKRVRAQLSTGDIFVVPAGHPVTFVASQNENLGLLGFGLYNGQDNKRIFVAGKTNNVRQWDRQAKELAFGVESRLVDEVFNDNPQESYFVSGQSRRGFDERRGNTNPLSSFLDFARLF